jgi:hypothetical protein
MVVARNDLSISCPSEGWTAAELGAYVGGGHFGIVEILINPIVPGEGLEPLGMNPFDIGNAQPAAGDATMPRDEVLYLLRDHGASAPACLRSLSNENLDGSTTLPAFGPETVAAQQVIEMVLIGHPRDHTVLTGSSTTTRCRARRRSSPPRSAN